MINILYFSFCFPFRVLATLIGTDIDKNFCDGSYEFVIEFLGINKKWPLKKNTEKNTNENIRV